MVEGGRRVVTKASSSISTTSGVDIYNLTSRTSKKIVETIESGVCSSSVTTASSVVSSSSQLPSPLPSPPPSFLCLASSSSSSISVASKQSRQSSGEPIQVVISHSTPPQSPFMLDDKQASTPFTLNRSTNASSVIKTNNTTHSATSTIATTTTAGDIVVGVEATSEESGVIAGASTNATVVTTDSSVEAHTPPESNDGTETQIRLAELNSKLARFNQLNTSFQSDATHNSAALDLSRRRLRAIHIGTFNRHVATYLDHKQQQQTSIDDQVVGEEIAYELARRRDDDRKDYDYDDDDQVSTSSSSSEDECNAEDDDQLIVDTESRGLENEFYFRTTGDVHKSSGHNNFELADHDLVNL